MRFILTAIFLSVLAAAVLAAMGKIPHPVLAQLRSVLPSGFELSPSSILPKSISLEKTAVQSGEKKSTESAGVVAGATTSTGNLEETIQRVASTVSRSAATIFTQSPDAAQKSIDVGVVVSNIQSQVDKIPAAVIEQAKIEYCKQVLENAKNMQK